MAEGGFPESAVATVQGLDLRRRSLRWGYPPPSWLGRVRA